ncbi:MAG: ankyrin repeat domain-containing protein [Acidobacteriota bacterium]|nr:ankyrin repeat domain-containing protein [Acidobacteriota bacterium]
MKSAPRLAFVVTLCLMPSLLSVYAAPADSPVADAAMRGDAEQVETLLSQGADVQTARADGLTALHWAARRNNVDLVEMLVYAGANLEASTRLGQHTPLHVASKSGQDGVVRALLDAGADPRATTSSGATPLHLAAQAGNAEAASALLDAGAEVNERESTWGQTPLMFAAAANRLGPITVLMERGAALENATRVVDLPGLDAIDRAAARRRQEVLDGYRAAAPVAAQQGWQPSGSQVQAAVRAAREIQAFPELAERPNSDGETVYRGTPRAYTERVGTPGGLTALLHAARQGHSDVAMALLYAGADINHVSGDHTSPLQIATMNGHFDLALRLIERGADPNLATEAGATPLFAALNLQWAPRARYPQPRAHDQQNATYLDVMNALLEAGAEPNVRLKKHLWYMSYNHCCSESVDGATPFWRAAYATDVKAMKLLMSYGADPHVPTRAPEPRRRSDDVHAVQETDPSGLPPVEPGGPGVWPIHAASGVGYGEGFESNAHRHVPDGWMPSIAYLVKVVGVDVNVRDHEGYNAVHHAAARGDTELVQYLVDHGADVQALSRRGQTTADMANGPYQRTLPFPDTLALLESLGAVNNNNCVSC